METLRQQIRDKFTSLGWNKELEDHDVWVNEQEVMTNMGTIIINGQQMHQQGQKKISTQIFEAQYECEVKDIDTENVEEMVHVMPMTNVLREDERDQKFSRESLLEGAPERSEDSWQVPRLVK